jgi:hypothetical protein
MKTENNKLRIWIPGILLIAIGVLFFLYWAQKKEIWFCDEVYSYESANGFEQPWPATFVDEWMSGQDVERFFAADSDKLSLREISVRLYSDHVPLYFWIFRMVSFFGFHGSGTIWIGLLINLVFYLGILGISYWGCRRLTGSSLCAMLMVLGSSVINRLMLEHAMTLRMYMMLLFEEIILLLAAIWIVQKKEEGKLSLKGFVLLFIGSLAGLLTHYDFWIFYASTALVFCGWLFIQAVKSKAFFKCVEFKVMFAWVINFLCALLLTIVVFPYCRWNLNRGKGEMALHSMFVFSKEKIDNILWGYERQSKVVFGDTVPVFIGLIIIFGCIIGGIILLHVKKEKQKKLLLILVGLVCQLYQWIVCFTFPAAREERYLWGTYATMVWLACYGAYLLVAYLWNRLKGVGKSSAYIGISMIVLMLLFMAVQVKIIDQGRGVAYLFNEQKDLKALEDNAHIPWMVYGQVMDAYSYWDTLIPENICFLTEENTLEDENAVKDMPKSDCFILYTRDNYLGQALDFFEETLQKEFKAEEMTQSVNLKVYMVTMQ